MQLNEVLVKENARPQHRGILLQLMRWHDEGLIEAWSTWHLLLHLSSSCSSCCAVAAFGCGRAGNSSAGCCLLLICDHVVFFLVGIEMLHHADAL